jgi:hypothetical protein
MFFGGLNWKPKLNPKWRSRYKSTKIKVGAMTEKNIVT